MSNNQGDLFGMDDDDLELEQELRGPSKFDASSIPLDHPYLPQNQNKTTKSYDLTNWHEGQFGQRTSWYTSFTPMKSTSEYLRSSSYGNYYDNYGYGYGGSYKKKADTEAIVQEQLHEVLKELNKTINLTSNSNTGNEEVLHVKYSNGMVVNDLMSNTLFVSPNVMLENEEKVKTGEPYYESLDGLNGQAMLCAFMKKGIHTDANTQYKESQSWATRNIFMSDIQSTAAGEVFSKWPGFMSYITQQMTVFGVRKDVVLNRFKQEVILLDDLIECLCYNRLAPDKIDYSMFDDEIVKKMLLADKDFNDMMDIDCEPAHRFQKAVRIYENIRDILNLDTMELNARFDASGMTMPAKPSDGGDPSLSGKKEIKDEPSELKRDFTGDNSYNNHKEIEGDIVSGILDHNKKMKERLKELEDKLNSDLNQMEILKDVTYKMMIPPVNKDQIADYDNYVRSNRKAIDSIKNGMMFHNNHPNVFSYGLTDGDIDEHALYKIHFGECERIFERKDIIGDKSYHVTLVIDQSGSMGGGMITEAAKLCILFSEALKYLKATEVSIYGFETHEIRTWVYKDKMYDKTKALIHAKEDGGTAMGYHLGAIGDKVITQYGEFDNKFMFVICDGGPTHAPDGMTPKQHTAKVIQKLRQKGIKVYGIGILNAFDESTGNEIFGEGNFSVIDDVAGSLPVLCNRMRKYLQKTSKM